MKTIGLLGGMSWESTAVYYRLLNEAVRARTGGHHSAPIVLESVDFHDIHRFQHDDDWASAGDYLASAARRIEAAGADMLLLCTNTMHIVAPAIEDAVSIPFLNLLDATGEAIANADQTTVGLLGTRFTVEMPFYREKLRGHGVEARTPDAADRQTVHDIIYEELCQGVISDASRDKFLQIIEKLRQSGAEGIIAGCTEIGLLINQRDLSIPLFDTTQIHVNTAVDAAMAD